MSLYYGRYTYRLRAFSYHRDARSRACGTGVRVITLADLLLKSKCSSSWLTSHSTRASATIMILPSRAPHRLLSTLYPRHHSRRFATDLESSLAKMTSRISKIYSCPAHYGLNSDSLFNTLIQEFLTLVPKSALTRNLTFSTLRL